MSDAVMNIILGLVLLVNSIFLNPILDSKHDKILFSNMAGGCGWTLHSSD